MDLGEWRVYEVSANLIRIWIYSKYCRPLGIRHLKYTSSNKSASYLITCCQIIFFNSENSYSRPYHIVQYERENGFKSWSFTFFICSMVSSMLSSTQCMQGCLIGEPYQILIIHFKGLIHLNNDENVIDAWINRFWTENVWNLSELRREMERKLSAAHMNKCSIVKFNKFFFSLFTFIFIEQAWFRCPFFSIFNAIG